MHEQSVLVMDLINCNASELEVERERRKLQILELTRFRQFRHSVWDKICQKYTSKLASSKNMDTKTKSLSRIAPKASLLMSNSGVSGELSSGKNISSALGNLKLPSSASLSLNSSPILATNQVTSESVDMSIDVQVMTILSFNKCLLFLD